MKKLISLFLFAVLLLSFTACSNPLSGKTDSFSDTTASAAPEGFVLCQEWTEVSGVGSIFFDAEGNFYVNGETYKYTYDAANSVITVHYYTPMNMMVVFEDGIYKLKFLSEIYVPSSAYPQFHAIYVQQRYEGLIAGRTEVLPGYTYTTASGSSFTLLDTEITGDNPCTLALYIEGNVFFSYPSYSNADNTTTFPVAAPPINSTDSSANWYYGGYQDRAALEADRAGFGIFCFTIDDSPYYVNINTFFQ